MNGKQLSDICRTCATTESNKSRLHPINGRLEDYPEMLADMLQQLVKFDLPDDLAEKLPQYMCHGCTRRLLDAHDFVAQARDATEVLIKQLIKDEPVETIVPPMEHWLESRFVLETVAENPFEDETMIEGAKDLDKTRSAHLDEFEVKIESDVMETVAAESQSQSQSEQNPGEKIIQCIVCDKIFDTPALLKVHRRTHGEKPFKCDLCGMAFKSKSHLQRHKTRQSHQRTHMEKPTFKCDLCEREFAEELLLKLHQRKHAAKKIHECDLCGKTFNQRYNLLAHQRTHTGERPFQCDGCDLSFRDRSAMQNHRRKHTGEKPFKCDLCQETFSQNRYLKTHRRTHTGEKPFKCYLCEETFGTSYYLQQHVKTHE